MVQLQPDPPTRNQHLREADFQNGQLPGAIAQLGERLLCKQEVTGSIPVGSTRFRAEGIAERQAFSDAFCSAAL